MTFFVTSNHTGAIRIGHTVPSDAAGVIAQAFGGEDHATISAIVQKIEAQALVVAALQATLGDLGQEVRICAEGA
ncbi:hypothetical protein [Azorhizobium doebereinerae]|uniref:hypothetical protein n=1 Tax=Azorhizobium doebereinerae TaxID=281091 RepID=UPI0003FB262F|nr:hypothetical protein [Azorhizobium doebereinerae]